MATQKDPASINAQLGRYDGSICIARQQLDWMLDMIRIECPNSSSSIVIPSPRFII